MGRVGEIGLTDVLRKKRLFDQPFSEYRDVLIGYRNWAANKKLYINATMIIFLVHCHCFMSFSSCITLNLFLD